MKIIARIGMAAACAAMAAIGSSTVAAQDAATSPQSQYPPYQTLQNQPQPQQTQTQIQSGPATQQYPQQTAAQPAAQSPAPPFVLTPQQQVDLDKVLDDWERQSSQVTTFKCNFTHYVYDPTFLPPALDANGYLEERWIKQSSGEIKYSAPDKGLIEEEDVQEVSNPGTPKEKVVKKKYGEHWACDGKTLYAVDHEKKQVHRTLLPPEMQGKFITEGPLPFAFGTKAGPLKARYFLRIITPPDDATEVWLEIRPRFQRDLTNFVEVDVILRAKDMLPMAINIVHAELQVPVQSPRGQKIAAAKQREVYKFDEKWFTLPNLLFDDFAPHPFNYTIIDEKSGLPSPVPPANNPQARRQWPSPGAMRPY